MNTTDSLQETWDYLSVSDDAEEVDVIFLFGSQDQKAPSKAYELLREGYAPIVLATGSYGIYTKGKSHKTEAESFKEALLSLGASQEEILIEPNATNTAENINFGMQVLQKANLNIKKAIVINRPYMMKRILATFNKLFPQIEVICCPTNYTLDDYINWMDEKQIGRAEKRLKEEVLRLYNYPKQGFFNKVEIPSAILEYSRTQGA